MRKGRKVDGEAVEGRIPAEMVAKRWGKKADGVGGSKEAAGD
jgi:hypothetical protein